MTTVGASKVACGVTGAARQQQPELGTAGARADRVPARDEEGGRDGLRRVRAPPVLRLADRDAVHAAADAGSRGNAPTAITLGNINVLIREVTRLYGNKRIWITEYGYQTNPPDPIFGVTLAKQARYLTQAFGIAKRNPRIDMMLWFLLRDETRARLEEGWQSGLLTASGTRKAELRRVPAPPRSRLKGEHARARRVR